MSDLISRSALIELIQKDIEKTASFMNTAKKYDASFEKLYGQLNTLRNYKSIISDMTAAYDVSKVIEELEEKQHQANKDMQISELYEDVQAYGGKYLAFGEAIEIVKAGGVE